MLPQVNIENILKSMHGKRVLVLGDLIMDHYLTGSVDRISPEAPVPIVSMETGSERWVPGGAANVARNITSLGGTAIMAGLVGDDEGGERLLGLLDDEGIDTSSVVTDPSRPTTSKTRIMSGSHQLLRLDSEDTRPASSSVMERLLSAVLPSMEGFDSIVLGDYNKGVLVPGLIEVVIREAATMGVPVAVDPKFENFFAYTGCSLFKPNRTETSRALGRVIRTVDEATAAGVELLGRLDAGAVMITLGEDGAVLCAGGEPPFHRPAPAMHVFDVSGAGDTVIAVMALGLASGLPLTDGVRISGFAAAATCAEPGVYAVSPADVMREVDRYSSGDKGTDTV